MDSEIMAVGGYSEVGRNMTALRVGDDVVIFDMGLQLDNYIKLTEEADIVNLSSNRLIKVGAVPDIEQLGKWRKKVRAIIPSHAHLDHIGAIPFLSNRFSAPIICTPFAAAGLEGTLRNEKITLKNPIQCLN